MEIGEVIPIAVIPDDQEVEKADLAAVPVSMIPADSPARVAVMDLAQKIRRIAGKRDKK